MSPSINKVKAKPYDTKPTYDDIILVVQQTQNIRKICKDLGNNIAELDQEKKALIFGK
jgi:DNA integrity scanning protein DisA with diadenylate cyclase activity